MSLEDETYYEKKYLKYKQKYLALEDELQGAGLLGSIKKAATAAASNPALQQLASSAANVAASAAAQNPTLQAKLAQAQQVIGSNPLAQAALADPKLQALKEAALANPTLQALKQAAMDPNNPDSVWVSLTPEKKAKLIALLPTIQ